MDLDGLCYLGTRKGLGVLGNLKIDRDLDVLDYLNIDMDLGVLENLKIAGMSLRPC